MPASTRTRSLVVLLVFTLFALVPLLLFLAQPLPALGADAHPAGSGSPPVHKPKSIFVTNNNDSGAGSLRDAIATAADFDNIFFAPNVSGTITLTSGELLIDRPINIIGPGESALAISGNNASRVIEIADFFLVDISGLTIRDGKLNSNGIGAGILISDSFLGNVNLTNVSIISNTISGSPCDSCYGAGVLVGFFNNVNMNNVTIKGNRIIGTSGCTDCSGGGISNGHVLNLTNVTVSENTVQATGGTCFDCFGGGIDNLDGILTVLNSRVNNNSISGSSCGECFGGGLSTYGLANLTNVTLDGNSITDGGVASIGAAPKPSRPLRGKIPNGTRRRAPEAPANGAPLGGGIFNYIYANLNNVTLSGNVISPVGLGGAIHNDGQMNVTNATLSGNTTSYAGGISNGIFYDSPVITLTNVTLNANSASSGPVSILNITGTTFLRNTIVANSSATGNCDIGSGAFIDQGNNMDSGNTCNLTAPSSMTNTNPNLAPLGNFGGFSKTHPPFAGSPALDAANNSQCPPLDQRGAARPQGPRCDIGAVEFGTGLRSFYYPLILKHPLFNFP